MAACHFCFTDLSVKEWLVMTAAQIELVINQKTSLRVPPCVNRNMHKRTASRVTTRLSVFVPVSLCTLNMAASVCTFLPSCKPGIWHVSLRLWWASLSQMDGLSQC